MTTKIIRSAFHTPLLAALALAAVSALPAAACDAHAGEHLAVTPEELQWQSGPGSLPPGAEFVVIEGNPAEAGPLTLRLRFPANYQVPAHTHPAIEHITVLSGVLNVGMGDKLDMASSRPLGEDGFVVMPVGHSHFVWTGEAAAVLQLHSMGPWGMTYINPEDDPRIN